MSYNASVAKRICGIQLAENRFGQISEVAIFVFFYFSAKICDTFYDQL